MSHLVTSDEGTLQSMMRFIPVSRSKGVDWWILGNRCNKMDLVRLFGGCGRRRSDDSRNGGGHRERAGSDLDGLAMRSTMLTGKMALGPAIALHNKFPITPT
jgi:hypothetical protein